LFAKKVAKALEATVPCKRIGIAVIGLEVPHAHIHLIPLNTLQDITFTKAVVEVSAEEMASIAAAVAKRIANSE
jgi:histidine triad (HIT) family protein